MAGEDLSQVLAAMQQQPKMKWTDMCKNFIKKIKAMKPKDRLEYASCVADLLYIITMSTQGWAQWYKIEFSRAFGPKPLSDIPEEQFEQIFEFFKTIGINMLEFDIQVTEVAEKQQDEEQKKTKPKKKTDNGRKGYTA